MNLNSIKKISFIGAGNMAQAIIHGLKKQGLSKAQLCATARSEATRSIIKDTLDIQLALSNKDACENADVVVLAVKPQGLKEVCLEIAPALKPGTLVISVVAGIRCASIESWLGEHAITRCMPNTPSSIGLGASGLFSNKHASSEQKAIARSVLSAVGLAIEVEDEKQIDTVTAISGSAPAYFFLFIEAMVDAGTEMGLDKNAAAQLAIQTALGAAELAKTSEYDVAELRSRVTSPNGTTHSAIQSFEASGLRAIVAKAMGACSERANELSDQLGSN